MSEPANQKKGFSGLADLTSDIEPDLLWLEEAHRANPATDKKHALLVLPQGRRLYVPCKLPLWSRPEVRVATGVLMALGMWGLLSLVGNDNVPVAPAYVPPTETVPAETRSTETQAPPLSTLITDGKHPQGELSYEQVRDCMFDNARLDAASGMVHPSNQRETAGLVAARISYDLRCKGSFAPENGLRAQAEVRDSYDTVLRDAENMVNRWDEGGSPPRE